MATKAKPAVCDAEQRIDAHSGVTGHISGERLLELVSDSVQSSEAEDSHLETCEKCLRRFIEVAKECLGPAV